MAKELECDEDEAAFEDKVRRVVKATVGDPDSPEWTAEDFARAQRVKGGSISDHEDKVRKVATAPAPADADKSGSLK